MKVSDAIGIFTHAFPNDKEKIKNFVQVINNTWENPDADIREYLEHVFQNTDHWLDNVLPGYFSYHSKRKPQAALNSFLDMDIVIEHLGEEYVKKIKRKVSLVLKKSRAPSQDSHKELDPDEAQVGAQGEEPVGPEVEVPDHVLAKKYRLLKQRLDMLKEPILLLVEECGQSKGIVKLIEVIWTMMDQDEDVLEVS
jgi:hypothetical protein